MSVTIKDVAKAAGVSASTVSRTISDHYSISEETKEKVRQVMDELGYNIKGSTEKIKTIGVVFPKSTVDAYENPFYLETIRGIGMVCNQRHYIMTIITGADDKELRTSIRFTNADGYIFLYSDIDDKLINYMYEEHLLFVLLGKATTMVNETLCVDTDNIHAAYEAVNYLISMGHKKIGYIGTDERRVFSFDRKNGYIQAMNENNLEIKDFYIQSLSSNTTYAHRNILKILKRNDRPTAYLVCDDIHAVMLERLVREAGLSVPKDISIVSFNNTLFARLMNPPLTSFDINSRQLGIEAASQLIKHIENPELFATRIIVPYVLMKRESVAYLNENNE